MLNFIQALESNKKLNIHLSELNRMKAIKMGKLDKKSRARIDNSKEQIILDNGMVAFHVATQVGTGDKLYYYPLAANRVGIKVIRFK